MQMLFELHVDHLAQWVSHPLIFLSKNIDISFILALEIPLGATVGPHAITQLVVVWRAQVTLSE